MRVAEQLRATGEATDILGDLELDTISLRLRPLDRADELAADYIALDIDADTHHGGHFHYTIQWDPNASMSTFVQIVQAAGGVVHA